MKSTKTPKAEPPVSEVQAQLRNNGLKSTAPRLAVLSYLMRVEAPVSHSEIVDALADRGFDRATLYRNLMDLTEAGLVSRSDLGDHVWRFEWKRAPGRGHAAEHPHFMCTDCGEVSCLPRLAVRVFPTEKAPKAFGTKDIEVQVKGRCDRCATAT